MFQLSVLTRIFVYPYLPGISPVPLFIYVLRWTLIEQKNATMFIQIYSEDRIALNPNSPTYYLDTLVKLIHSLCPLFP